MRKLLFLVMALIISLSRAQKIEFLFEIKSVVHPEPSLDPFSKFWVLNVDDSVYVITPEDKVIRGAGFPLKRRNTDIFIDTLVSCLGEVGIVKYTINENNVVASKIDDICISAPIAVDPINKLAISPAEDKRGWYLLKVNLRNYHFIIEDTIKKIILPDSTIINWQWGSENQLENWILFKFVNWYYSKGSFLVCIRKNDYKIKFLNFPVSAPVGRNYAYVWERIDKDSTDKIVFCAYIRMKIIESYEDINMSIIDTIYCSDINPVTVRAIGSLNGYNFFSIVNNKEVVVEALDSLNNKIKLLQIPNPFNDRNRVVTSSFNISPQKAKIIFTIAENLYGAIRTGVYRIFFPLSNLETNSHLYNFNLYQNYPNPFNPTTTIEFDIPERTNVKLVVYDILGREVETLIDKELEPGKYKVNFEAKDLPSSVYFYTLRTPKFTKTNKMILIK
jgi:hypothetical protein